MNKEDYEVSEKEKKINFYIKKDDHFIPVDVSYFSTEILEKAAFIVAVVGDNTLPASKDDLEEMARVLNAYGLQGMVLPHFIKIASFEIKKDSNYLFTVTIPEDSSRELEEKTYRFFKEFSKKYSNVSFKIVEEVTKVVAKEVITKENKLPEITQQEIIHLDGTPDNDYVLRILRVYRENCNCKWSSDLDNPLIATMNNHQEQRAKLLDEAIEILEKKSYVKIDTVDSKDTTVTVVVDQWGINEILRDSRDE